MSEIKHKELDDEISSIEASSIENSTTEEDLKTDWRSIIVASILSFVGSVQFSLYFSALWVSNQNI